MPLLIGILFTANGFSSLKDVFLGDAKGYNEQLSKRFEVLKNNTQRITTQAIRLEPLMFQPKCLFSSDITDNPKDWTNQAYNLYFRKDSTEIYLK